MAVVMVEKAATTKTRGSYNCPMSSWQEFQNAAPELVSAVGGDFMGADILVDQDDGLWALEVNGSFAFGPEDQLIAGAMAEKIMQLARS